MPRTAHQQKNPRFLLKLDILSIADIRIFPKILLKHVQILISHYNTVSWEKAEHNVQLRWGVCGSAD